MTRVTVSSSVPAVQAGLERLLEGDPGIIVVRAAAGAPEGEAEVVVLSADPLWRGLLAEILGSDRERPAPVLVTDDEAECRFLATQATGHMAWAAVRAAVSSAELCRAAHAVASGLVVVHPDLLPGLLGALPDAGYPTPPLTDREREVLDLLAKGFSNPEIARLLGISEHTVKFHTSSLYAKLGVANRTEAVGAGIRAGAIHL